MRPTRASPTSSESMTTNETSSAPATPVMRAEPTGREIAAAAATSTRGLIMVLSAPVSSSRFALAVPLTFTSTMIRWPGVYLIEVPPGFGAPGAVPGPSGASPGRPGDTGAAGIVAGAGPQPRGAPPPRGCLGGVSRPPAADRVPPAAGVPRDPAGGG